MTPPFSVAIRLNAQAGRPTGPTTLIDVNQLVTAYYEVRPDPSEPSQRVAFGTSGHHGSALQASFNRAHIVAITQAICRHRRIQGPTEAPFSRPGLPLTFRACLPHAIEVLAATAS